MESQEYLFIWKRLLWLNKVKMNFFKSLFFVLLFIGINSACSQSTNNITAEKKNDANQETSALNTSDTLSFTSAIRYVLHDSKDRYWIGSHSEGVCYFDGETFTYFTIKDGLSDNQIRKIYEDNSGIIWFETGNGVSVYDNGKVAPKLISNKVEQKKLKNFSSDYLFFNNGDNLEILCYDGEQLDLFPLPFSNKPKANMSFGLTGVAKGKNKYWIATYSELFAYDGEFTERINDSTLNYNHPQRLHIRSIFEDSKENVWIGNNGIGVLLKQRDTIVNFSEQHNLLAEGIYGGNLSPPGTMQHVFAISEDTNGNIWFGDRDTGAWKFDGESLTNYTIDTQLNSAHIWQIYQDKNGELLFAMESGGVYGFNGSSFYKKF